MTNSKTRQKPRKPHPEFPLYPHASGRWAKKCRGKIHYFGPWSDPDGALRRWLEVKDDLLAGRRPRPKSDELAIRGLVNHFLTSRKQKVDCGELAAHSFASYLKSCGVMVATFGRTRPVSDLRPDDFRSLRARFAKSHGPTALAKDVQEIRTVFKWGVENGILDRLPLFGSDFRRPPARVLRKAKAKQDRTLTADQLRALIEDADQPLRTMILLGINAGFGPADCGQVPKSTIDLEAGWVDFARSKTGIPRRCPLWGETLESLREADATRPNPAAPADSTLFFLNQAGRSWATGRRPNIIGRHFRDLLKRLGLYREGLTFYSLRHTHRTMADGAQDQVASAVIMGHLMGDMAAHYRHAVDDARLQRVVDYVHDWLFSGTGTAGDEEESPATVPFRAKHG